MNFVDMKLLVFKPDKIRGLSVLVSLWRVAVMSNIKCIHSPHICPIDVTYLVGSWLINIYQCVSSPMIILCLGSICHTVSSLTEHSCVQSQVMSDIQW